MLTSISKCPIILPKEQADILKTPSAK